ncbi:MAG: DUF1028 domain-containing protein [Phycisphaerae bacterium]
MLVLIIPLVAAAPARATWSVILIDQRTGEIGVASATCLTGFDLAAFLPVIRVGVGAACAQSLVDQSSLNRRRIRTGFINGDSPDEILAFILSEDTQFRRRQYGIVDSLGNAATYSGTANGRYAGGVIGRDGNITYAIQGNVLTGAPVIEAAEQAVLNTFSDLPAKLMAAMEAARSMGGDGRCSCSVADPTACGSPPPSFTKSADVGFLYLSRRGDTDGLCNATVGCATGNYFLKLNIANQQTADPDPVLQLQEQFDAWRESRVGVPDAIITPAFVVPRQVIGPGAATLRVELCDWDFNAATIYDGITVQHDPAGSAGIAEIGEVQSLGNGVFRVPLTSDGGIGRDRFLITVSVGGKVRDVLLMPSPTWTHANPACDLDDDGDVDPFDLKIVLDNFGNGKVADVDGDNDTDLADLVEMLRQLY